MRSWYIHSGCESSQNPVLGSGSCFYEQLLGLTKYTHVCTKRVYIFNCFGRLCLFEPKWKEKKIQTEFKSFHVHTITAFSMAQANKPYSTLTSWKPAMKGVYTCYVVQYYTCCNLIGALKLENDPVSCDNVTVPNNNIHDYALHKTLITLSHPGN